MIPAQPSHWGEAEAREWRRKLRQEKERAEKETKERIEWRAREMRRLAEREWIGKGLEQERAAQWADFDVDETMPRLYAPSWMTLKRWTPPELLGYWNNIYSNSCI